MPPIPSPQNNKLAAPIRADFSMERFGPVATRHCNRAPLIRVVHRREDSQLEKVFQLRVQAAMKSS